MSETQNGTSGTSQRTPPYIAFKTFLTFIEDLKTHGLPPRIDRSVLRRFSGGVGSQILMALRSLGLVGKDDKPTPELEHLVETYGGEDFKAALRKLLDSAYPYISQLDLQTATPSMFADAFKANTVAKEDVLSKCRRFYMHAAEYAGYKLGPRLAAANPRRASASGRRSASPQPTTANNATGTNRGRRRSPSSIFPPSSPPTHSLKQQLVGKYPEFDPSWPDPIKAAWFEGFQRLMASVDTDKKDGGQQ